MEITNIKEKIDELQVDNDILENISIIKKFIIDELIVLDELEAVEILKNYIKRKYDFKQDTVKNFIDYYKKSKLKDHETLKQTDMDKYQ